MSPCKKRTKSPFDGLLVVMAWGLARVALALIGISWANHSQSVQWPSVRLRNTDGREVRGHPDPFLVPCSWDVLFRPWQDFLCYFRLVAAKSSARQWDEIVYLLKKRDQ
jgi:hypothetical protein